MYAFWGQMWVRVRCEITESASYICPHLDTFFRFFWTNHNNDAACGTAPQVYCYSASDSYTKQEAFDLSQLVELHSCC